MGKLICMALTQFALPNRMDNFHFSTADSYWPSRHYIQAVHHTSLTNYNTIFQPTRSLHSAGSHQLVKPMHNLSFGSHAFRMSVPHIWNLLPTSICEAQSVLTFRRHLKKHYFQSAFSTP